MNATQASRLLTLAYYLKTRVRPKRFHMGCYCNSPDGLATPKSIGCALGWASMVWPNVFRCRNFGVEMKVNGNWMHVNGFDIQTQMWFGITLVEAQGLFETRSSTVKNKAKQLEQLAYSYGYEYK